MEDVVLESAVVRLMRGDYREWLQGLSPEEANAIRKYSRNSIDKTPDSRFFARLNCMLRHQYNKEDSELLQKYADIISVALSRTPLKRNVLLYRGCDANPFAHLVLGSEVMMPQFLSTSVIKTRAFRGKYNLQIYAPIGTSGAYIEQLSAYPKQREFLLNAGCRLKLQDIEDDVYFLEVIV